MLYDSTFFKEGFYKKAKGCPEDYTKKGEERVICGKLVKRSGKWDPLQSLLNCGIHVSNVDPKFVETKFDGHRGIFEKDGDDGCIFSNKGGCNDKLLPRLASNLLKEHLKKEGIERTTLDGEMFLERCIENGKIIVPNIGTQTKAIKGDHPEMLENCNFTYKIFDGIKINDEDISDKILLERKKLLRDILPTTMSINHGNKGKLGKNITIELVIPRVAKSIEDLAQFACDVTHQGEEGIVIKDLDSKYEWKGRTDKKPSRSNWWKLKEALDIDGSLMKACLGNVTKTGQNTFRYRSLILGVCKDADCTEIVPINDRGVSSSVTGGDFSGFSKWDNNIHYPIIRMIKDGKAKHVANIKGNKNWRTINDIKKRFEGKIPDEKWNELEDTFKSLVNDLKNPSGELGLPECVEIPKNEMIISVVGTEVNVDKDGMPTLQGPPKLNIIRDDKKVPNDVEYVLSLAGR